MERKQSELTVITKAKDLCSYIMTVTQKSLHENSAVMKTYKGLKELRDWLPF